MLVDYLIPTFPKDVRWENYPNAMRYASFGRYMINTLIVGSSTIGTLVTTILAALLARLNFKDEI